MICVQGLVRVHSNWPGEIKDKVYLTFILVKRHQLPQSVPGRWSKDLSINREEWVDVFRAVNSV